MMLHIGWLMMGITNHQPQKKMKSSNRTTIEKKKIPASHAKNPIFSTCHLDTNSIPGSPWPAASPCQLVPGGLDPNVHEDLADLLPAALHRHGRMLEEDATALGAVTTWRRTTTRHGR